MSLRRLIYSLLGALTLLAGAFSLVRATPPADAPLPPETLAAVLHHADTLRRSHLGPSSSLDSAHTASPLAPLAGAIYGRLLADGVAAAGQSVYLRYYTPGSASTAAMTTTTTITGSYRFANPPTPPTGANYFVQFGPNTSNSNYVFLWYGPDIESYQAGEVRSGGDLNIATPAFVYPPPGATESFPATFRWTRRRATTDIYSWFLIDVGTRQFLPPLPRPLGYIDSITVQPSDAPGVKANYPYLWTLFILDSSGASGSGLAYPRGVIFSPFQTTPPTPTPSRTATRTPTASATPLASSTPTGTPTASPTATSTASPLPPTSTATAPAAASTPTATATASPAPTGTTPATATQAPSVTSTAQPTATDTPPTPTATPEPSATATPLPASPTATATPLPPTSTATATQTSAPPPTPTPTASATATAQPTATPTPEFRLYLPLLLRHWPVSSR